jgi:hypothetical protein
LSPYNSTAGGRKENKRGVERVKGLVVADSPMGEGRGVHMVLVGRPEGTRPLGRPKRRWEDNIKMGLQERVVGTGWSGLRIGTGGGHLWVR